jgi:hypothetical protein
MRSKVGAVKARVFRPLIGEHFGEIETALLVAIGLKTIVRHPCLSDPAIFA